MTPFTRLAVLALVACAHAQYQEDRAPRYIASEPKAQASTPVPILKQINRHNEDGSYTYGYEAADGSFKIETKSPAGEVKGKYGYKDDTGKVRVIEYGANKFGFQPSGEGITVAPPTLVDETNRDDGRPSKSQGGRNQYRPAPAQAIDYDYNDEPAPPPRPAPRPASQYRPQPQPQYRKPAPQPQYQAPPPARPQFRAPAPGQFTPPPPSPVPMFRHAEHPEEPIRLTPSVGPAKPAFFPGASPTPEEDNFFNPQPAPQRRQYQQKQQNYRPPQQFDYNQQQFAQGLGNEEQPSYAAPRAQNAQRAHNAPYSMLDQLLKEYALPANGAAPLHDITFGSY